MFNAYAKENIASFKDTPGSIDHGYTRLLPRLSNIACKTVVGKSDMRSTLCMVLRPALGGHHQYVPAGAHVYHLVCSKRKDAGTTSLADALGTKGVPDCEVAYSP